MFVFIYYFFDTHTYETILTGQHVDVGTVRNGEDVGWHFISPLASVELGAPVGVHRVALVGVDSHAEQTGVGLQTTHTTLDTW